MAHTADGDGLEFPHANIVAVEAIAGVLAPTLGPTPRDKLVVRGARQSGSGEGHQPETTVASDGATLLRALPLEHSIAPIVRRMVGPERPGDTDVEGQDIPDGITTRVVLAAALLDRATPLIDLGVHPNDVQRGYARGAEIARRTLRAASSPARDHEVRLAVARTALTGNDVGGERERWARLAVDAVALVGEPTETTFVVRAVGAGRIDDSRLVRGAVLDRNDRANESMPVRVANARVLVLGGANRGGLSDPDTAGITRTASLSHPDSAFAERFAEQRRALVERFVAAGVTVVCCRLGINAAYGRLLADAGILGVRGINRLKLQQVALATGATIVTHPQEFRPAHLGRAGAVREERIGKRRHRRATRRMIVVEECPDPGSVAVVLRGVSGQLAEQATTDCRKATMAVAAADGLGVREPGVVPGGGATEIGIADAIRERALTTGSREGLVLDAVADSVDDLTRTLGRNAGLDPLSVVADVRSAQRAGTPTAGVVLPNRKVADVVAAGVLDPLAVRLEAYETAFQVAIFLLRIDDAMDATFTREPAGPDDAIYDERAEKHMDWLDEHGKENATNRWSGSS